MSAAPEFKIYVGNLNYQTTEEGLSKAFAQYGQVTKSQVIKERFRGNLVSRGFGFVTFADKSGQDKALAATEISVDNRKLRIAEARPRRPRDTIFVGGIPEGTTEDDLKACFAAEKPTNVKIVKANSADRRGFAFVQFGSEDAVRAAAQKREVDLKGSKSIVRIARQSFGASRPRRFRRKRQGQRAPRAQEQKQ